MSVSVQLTPSLANYANNISTISVTGKTTGECLSDLVKQFPSLSEIIFGNNGKLQSYIAVFLNNQSAYPDELAKTVSDGDTIDLVLVISGG